MLDNPYVEIGLPIALIIIMIGMGLSLTTTDFRRVAEQPRAVAIGTLGQMVLIPALGFGLAYLLLGELGGVMAAGLVLVAILPGGTTSNLLTYLARANLALSITLTVIASLLTLITIPLLLDIALSQFTTSSEVIPLNWLESMRNIMLLVILPVGLGMLIRRAVPDLAQALEKPISIFSAMVLFGIVLLILILEWSNMPAWLGVSWLPVMLLNLSAIAIAVGMGLLARLPRADTITVAIELSIKNSTIGLTIALSVLESTELAIPSAVYGLLMYVSAIVMAVVSKRLSAHSA